jgi:uncharacterized protein YjiS (DUF1127 family)
MRAYRHDRAAGVMVYIATDSDATDQQYQELLDLFYAVDAEAAARGGESLTFTVVTANQIERPNATWRRRFADLRTDLRARRRLSVLISDSIILRGAIKVMNWLQPPPPEEQMGIFATFEEGVCWVEEMRGPSRALLYRLLDEVCADVGLTRAQIAGR